MNLKKCCIALTILAPLLASNVVSQLRAETITFATDTTWRAIGPVGYLEFENITVAGLNWESDNQGWNTSLAFNDSADAGWGDAVFNWHENIPNSIWPWGDSFNGPTPSYFRKTITIDGTPNSGAVDFVVDDDVQLYVNGALVFNDTNNVANFESGVGFSSSLTQGANLIAMKVHDTGGTEGFGGTFRITFQPIPEPSTAVLTIVALLCCLLWWAKKRGHSTFSEK